MRKRRTYKKDFASLEPETPSFFERSYLGFIAALILMGALIFLYS